MLIALLVCLIPRGLHSAVGIAVRDRVLHVNVLAMSGRAVDVAGDVSALLLARSTPLPKQPPGQRVPPRTRHKHLSNCAMPPGLSSLARQTPEGRSIVELAFDQGADDRDPPAGAATFVELTAQTRMSGLDLAGGNLIRKGANSAVADHGCSNWSPSWS